MTRNQPVPALARRAAGVLLIAVAACGSGTDSDSDVSSGGGSDPVWVGQVLEGEPGADQTTPIAVDGDQVVAAIISEDGVITGFATDEQGQFSAGTPAVSGHQYLNLGGITRLGDGWVAVGSGGLRDGEEILMLTALSDQFRAPRQSRDARADPATSSTVTPPTLSSPSASGSALFCQAVEPAPPRGGSADGTTSGQNKSRHPARERRGVQPAGGRPAAG